MITIRTREGLGVTARRFAVATGSALVAIALTRDANAIELGKPGEPMTIKSAAASQHDVAGVLRFDVNPCLPPDSATRARFSEDVLHRSIASAKSYWQQIIFAGRDVPPPELANDEDVVKYVARNPTAVGYVSGGTTLSGAKALTVD